jgi:multiple sugar transport system substrate-binding protein
MLVVGLAGSSAASAQRSAGTVTLQFWSAYNVADKEASTMANVIIPKFEQENPGIKVVSDVYPYSELLQKYLAASAAGNPPDLLRSDIAWVPELASQGLALKVSTLPWFSPIAKAALPGPLLTTEYKGSNYALPLDTNTQALFWNKADFAAAGISGPDECGAWLPRKSGRLRHSLNSPQTPRS